MHVMNPNDLKWDGTERRNELIRVARSIIVVVDEDPVARARRVDALKDEGFDVRGVESGVEALTENSDALVIVAAQALGDMTATALITELRHKRRHLPVILFGDVVDDVDVVIEALRAGAYDFVLGPLDPSALALSVRRAAKFAELTRDGARLIDARRITFGKFIGSSRRMRDLQDVVARVALSDVAVLVRG